MAEIRNTDSNTLLSGTNDNDTIQNGGYWYDGEGSEYTYHEGGSNVIINGLDGNDSIVSYSDSVSIDSGAGNDIIFTWGASLSINGGTGEDYFVNYDSNVTIDGGADSDYIYNEGSSVKIDGGVGKDSIENYSYRVTIDGGSGNDYIDNGGSNSTINGGAGDDSIGNKYNCDNSYIIGGVGNDFIINNGNLTTISGGKDNDTIGNGYEFMNNYIVKYDDDHGENVLFQYSLGDGNDVIYGFRADSTIQIAGSSYSTKKSGDDIIVTVGKGKISLMGAASLDNINILRETTYSDSSKANVTLGANIINADATARTKAIKIVGNALDNSILGGSGKDKLYGKDGNDTLSGGKGNDTLSGGEGDDLFVYTAGNDVITDYAEGDMISIGAAISKSSIKGSDATFTIGKNTLTVKDGFGKEIVFIDADGKERTIIGGAYLADNSSSSKSTLAAWREVGDASARTKAIKLAGNALDNTILGGSGKDSLYGGDGNDYIEGNAGNDKLYGQAGNDTLWGGSGNDTLIGGEGADVFIYASGDGKDVISGFDNNDMLQITGTFSASYDSTSKALAFTVDDGSITIKDFTAKTFNVNGIKYKIKGNNFVRK